MKALVTGGAGFIGSHVIDKLLENGLEVVALDNLSGGYRDNVDEKATFVEGSITDSKLVTKLFDKYKFDYVFHFAAYAAEGLSHFIRKFNYENNIGGSINLINESIKHKVKCFVFTSSMAVYGHPKKLPTTEDMVPHPIDPYGIAKYAIELDLEAANDIFGLNYIIFRPHNVYGERQNLGDRYRNVIGIFMNQIMENEPLTIFGDGKQTRAFSYIDSVAPVIAESIFNKKAYNQVFNIGADKDYNINDLSTAVCDAFGVEKVIKQCEPRNEVKHIYCDHTKLRKTFVINEDVTLSEGLKRMAIWAKNKGPMKKEVFENIEITEKVPKIWMESIR